MTERADGQVTWSDLGFSFGRTLSEHSAATKEKTSQPCWKKLRVLQNQDFLYLDCRKSGNGQKQEPLTVMGGLSLGELITLNAGEKPSETAVQEMLYVWGPHSVAEESRLSQILEVNPLPKYNLTAKACLGILRRAERRGKDLPKLLKAVLIRQSQGALPQERTEAPAPTEAPTSYAVRIRSGCDGGGKGALVQEDKSGTLGTGKEGDPSPTLTAGDRHGVAYISGVDGYNGDLTGDVASTIGVNCGMSTGRNGVMELSANENGGMARDSVLCAGFKAGQGAQAGGIGYSEEVSPKLASAPSGTNQTPAVVALDMSHACDVIRDCGEVSPRLQARMGTGGNQVPLTYQQTTGTLSPGAHAGSYNGQDAYNDMLVVSSEISPTLRAKGNDPYREDMAAYIASVDCRNFCEDGRTNGTLQAKSNGGTSYNLQNTIRTGMVVRRLTPMECERLQGFPDGWTDIGDWVKTDKRGREIKVKGSVDSPRYKALGNSIALPFWDFLAKRISAQYLRPVTMGSLFDGIGGFPLVFERHNGKGTARWASEIEEFPIAVTKLRFGEE